MPIMDQGVRMFRCAVFTRGCLSTLTVPNMPQKDVDLLLNLNGWQKNYGRWVCGGHVMNEEEVSDELSVYNISCSSFKCQTRVVLPKMSKEDIDSLLRLNDWFPGIGDGKWVCNNHAQIIKGD